MAKIGDNTELEVCECGSKCEFCDPESQKQINPEFDLCESTPTYIRHEFIRKVFLTVLIQLVFAFGFMLICYNIKATRLFFIRHQYICHGVTILYIISTLLMGCFPSLTKSSTVSLLCICYFTPLITFSLTGYACLFNSKEVGITLGTLLAVVILLVLFSFQTKYDFTKWVVPLCFLTLQFIITVSVLLIFRSRIKSIIFSCIGTVLYTLWIIIDVQMIIGGNHVIQFTIDDYFFASLSLFTDIVSLFMNILRLVHF